MLDRQILLVVALLGLIDVAALLGADCSKNCVGLTWKQSASGNNTSSCIGYTEAHSIAVDAYVTGSSEGNKRKKKDPVNTIKQKYASTNCTCNTACGNDGSVPAGGNREATSNTSSGCSEYDMDQWICYTDNG